MLCRCLQGVKSSLLVCLLAVLLIAVACGGSAPSSTATAVPSAAGTARDITPTPTRAESIVQQTTPNLAGAAQKTPSPTLAETLTTKPTPGISPTNAGTPKATVAPISTSSTEATSTPVSPRGQATPLVPAFDFQAVTVTGLIATVPGYASLDATEVAELLEGVYPGRVPRSVQALVLLTEDDEVYLILALDTHIDRFITAGTVVGHSAPPLPGIPTELDFANRLIVSDDVKLMEPVRVTPDQVNQAPERYAFKRVVSHTTYAFSSVRVKDAPPSLDHIGFGLATDKFGSQSPEDYLTVIDPYNTEAQIRVADLIETVLFPTEGARRLLGQLYKFAPADVEEALSKPSLFYESLADDDPELHNIRDLAPTVQDPSPKLHNYHGETVSVQGIALGAMVRTEDIPPLKNIPIGLTAKLIGVADLMGAMPVIGISSEDVSGEVFGFFRFDLSVYTFADQAAYAFLINKEAVPLDPVEEVTRAEFGDRVKGMLNRYTVVETERIQLSKDLTLEQVDLLVPVDVGDPFIMTRHAGLNSGDYLDSVSFDGYLLDGRILGVPQAVPFDEPKTVVVNAANLSFKKGVPPTPEPPGVPTPEILAPPATPTSVPTLVPVATATPIPVPTATPIPLPTATPTPTPSYALGVSIKPSNGGTVALVPPGGTYPAGTSVTVSSAPAPGFTFDRWEGDISGSGTTTSVTMDGDKSVVAHFRRFSP